MGYRNLLIYGQRIIDRILRLFRAFARVYVNNIVIFFKSLKEYFKYLILVFNRLREFNICLFLKKSFLGYFSVVFLG